jgi:hypothetical protein
MDNIIIDNIVTPTQFRLLLSDEFFNSFSDIFVIFNPFDIENLRIVDNIISQLRDVFY